MAKQQSKKTQGAAKKAASKVAAKKAAPKKVATKKAAPKTAAVKKAVSKKTVTKKATSKAPAGKATSKQATAKKAPTKKAVAKKPAVKKVATKKTATKKAVTRKPAAKAAAVESSAVKAPKGAPAVKAKAGKTAKAAKPTKSKRPTKATSKAAAADEPATVAQRALRVQPRKPVVKGAQARAAAGFRASGDGKTASGGVRSRGRLFKSLGKKLELQRTEILDLYRNDLGQGQSVSHDGDDEVDRANHDSNRELALAISTGERETLKLISEALERLKGDSFGDCTNCGRVIADLRLEAIPWARHCVDCQELEERGLLDT